MTWIKTEEGLLVNLEHIEAIIVQKAEEPVKELVDAPPRQVWVVLGIRPAGGTITFLKTGGGNSGEREAQGLQRTLAAMVGTYDLNTGHMVAFPGKDGPQTEKI